MPCPFTGPKIFCAGPNVLSQSKNLIAFSASSKTFVPAQKPNLVNGLMPLPCSFTGPKMFSASSNVLSHSKNLIAFSASSKTFVPAQKPILLNANHLLVWHKMFVTGTIFR